MKHHINIEGIQLYGYHGCLEEEAKIGGNYIVDVYMQTDFTEAAQTDDLEKTIDYCSIFEISKAEMAIHGDFHVFVQARAHPLMYFSIHAKKILLVQRMRQK